VIQIRKLFCAAALASVSAFVPSLSAAPASAATVPFSDPNAKGYIGLCDRNGHPVTSGSLDDIPFVWTAVSSTPAPTGYEHGKATLYAYQPRQHVAPSQWEGRMLTASSSFTNPAHPMAQATNGDSPLLWFVQAFPPQWNGLVQLRMFYSAANSSVDLSPYPATVLQVSGNRWSEISGGGVPCNVGKAVSAETVDLPASELVSPQTIKVFNSPAGGSSSGPSTTQPSASNPQTGAESSNKSSEAVALPNSPASSGGLATGAIVGIVGGALALIVALGTWIWRRRGRPGI
jgi:hypothetical protein